MKTVLLTDIPWGYGTPQVKFLKQSLEETFESECFVICPTYDSRPILSDKNVESFITKQPTFQLSGLREYITKAAGEINRIKPEHIVVFNPRMLLAINQFAYKPKVLTYYGLETLGSSNLSPVILNSEMAKVDVALFPEFNRLKVDAPHFKNLRAIFEVYNSQPIQTGEKTRIENDLIYAGTLDPGWIEFGYLEEIDKVYDLKVFGDLTELPRNGASNLKNAYGLLSEQELRPQIEKSKFSVVCWKPNNFALFNAAPNKLFQSLSCNTPVITYPYPQALKLAETYSGIFVAKEFSIESLIQITEYAFSMDSSSYKSMQKRIGTEFRDYLLWSKQILPFIKYLKGTHCA